MHFPSPPTSPRVFNFGNLLDTSLPYAAPSLSSSKCSSSATPALTADLSSEGHSTTDDNRPSLDEIMQAQAIDTSGQAKASEFSILPELSTLNLLVHGERISLSLPAPSSVVADNVQQRTHASSPPAALAAHMEASPSMPGAGSSSLPVKPLRPPPLALRAPAREDLGLGVDVLAPAKPRLLRASKSTESFMGRLRTNVSKENRASPMHTATPILKASFPEEQGKATARKRKASLSIKIPKLLSKLKKHDELLAPALPDTPLEGLQSRFSPDSEAPVRLNTIAFALELTFIIVSCASKAEFCAAPVQGCQFAKSQGSSRQAERSSR